MGLVDWENIERRHVLVTALRAFATSVAVIAAYFLVPIAEHPDGPILLRLVAGLVLFAVVLVYEVRAIIKAEHPVFRAAIAMALILPIFLVVFSWTYLTMSRSAPRIFTQRLDRVSALYFAVTVFTTVGFGDITPQTDPARIAVTLQMIGDVIVIAVVIRLILEAARGTFGARSGT